MKNVFRFLIIFLAIVVLKAYGEQVTIPDTNLAAVVQDALGLNPSDPIPKKKLEKLETLYAVEKDIGDLTGLEKATGLKTLIIHGYYDQKKITDITPLAGLTQLTKLSLSGNRIKDIKPLANLTQLKDLKLNNNSRIRDITPLTNLKQLIHLSLYNNLIRDITPLAELKQLKSLRIFMNEIRDITPLTNLKQLIHLDISINYISDITPLANLKQLPDLRLQSNQIRDITPLANLKQLTHLDISDNEIRDITPLTELTQLTRVSLSNNLIINEQDIALLHRRLFGQKPATKYFPHSLGSSWVYEDQDGNEFIRRAIEAKEIGNPHLAFSYEPVLEDKSAYSPFIYPSLYHISDVGIRLLDSDAVEESIKARLKKEMLFLIEKEILFLIEKGGAEHPDAIDIAVKGQDHLLLMPDTLVLDEAWGLNQIKGTIKVESVNDTTGASTLDFTITETGRVLGIETIQTPAGQFEDCLKVEYRTKTEAVITPAPPPDAVNPPGETITTIWFAPDIGIVKYHEKSGFIVLSLIPAEAFEDKLDRYTFKLSMERTLELKKYDIQ